MNGIIEDFGIKDDILFLDLSSPKTEKINVTKDELEEICSHVGFRKRRSNDRLRKPASQRLGFRNVFDNNE